MTRLKVVIYLILVLAGLYCLLSWQVMNRLPPQDLTYLYVNDAGPKSNITSFPILRSIKNFYWKYMGGKSRVYAMQDRSGDIFIFLMNVEDDAKYTDDIDLNDIVLSKLKRDIYCLGINGPRIEHYKNYAVKNKNQTMSAYLANYSAANCRNKKGDVKKKGDKERGRRD